ncbi:AsmA-like C-terminal region-containing protein [Methylobacterium sp. NEAU 140]|uniref:AsmA family protein n=1 Tax=Methylobacterium sp. NEAU 140 TaxID=3064945 RepID=UPI0027328A5F|nr:AsmA-like C-terminal region-containing protein [Methylobacterium sp. NEAU 140]MDP4025579.1 AsmA-like C-terminal region-containing protein [Methylobacterium sp. NEAU 140]
MPPSRPIVALALAGLILAGLGLRDWPVETGRATAFANRTLGGYGLALAAEGPATLTLLPLPRLAFSGARLAAGGPGGPSLAEGARLAVDLDLPGLLAGRAAIGGLTLDGARLSDDAAAWAGPLARLADNARAGLTEHPRRIVLTGARVGDGALARDLDLDLAWPFWSAAADARARLTWRGVPTRLVVSRLRPAELALGRRSPFAAEAGWPGGGLAAEGTAGLPETWGGLPSLTGRARGETRALPETLAWLGGSAPLLPFAGAFDFEGDFEAAGRTVSWPRLRVGVGGAHLEGAGALVLGTGTAGTGTAPRLSVQATLAADSLNLAPVVAALVRPFEPGTVPLALGPYTRADLDLRLSAAASRVGPVQIEDLAASVLVRAASVEVALNRARIQGGTLKGRVLLTRGADPAETEVRAQGGFDRLDLGGLISDAGEGRWVLGAAQGQFALESGAREAAGLLSRVSGRASLAIDGGAITGLDLADVIHRNGAVAPGALARRNGRTGFERASVGLRFTDGVGEITDAVLRGPGIGATLRGQLSLPEGRLDAQAGLALRPPADPSRALLFEIAGPWDAVAVRGLPGTADPDRAGEALPPRPLAVPAAAGLPANARAFAP